MKTHIDNATSRMEKVIERLKHDLAGVRTGRANASILDDITIDYYGSETPLNQVSGISVVEGRQLVVKPYDSSFLKEIERAINASDLGIAPMNDGSVIRLNVPSLTEETRKALVKGLGKNNEDAKIAIRNVRRDINEAIKKDDSLNEDLEKKALEEIQKITDKYIKLVDELTDIKSKEIMTI